MIEVFKTNISTPSEAATIVQLLLQEFPTFEIHFDLQDCDRVLRIAQCTARAEDIIRLVQNQGFWCEVMDDQVMKKSKSMHGFLPEYP
jgi:hypothetical protein